MAKGCTTEELNGGSGISFVSEKEEVGTNSIPPARARLAAPRSMFYPNGLCYRPFEKGHGWYFRGYFDYILIFWILWHGFSWLYVAIFCGVLASQVQVEYVGNR